jgi:hypothetical protein
LPYLPATLRQSRGVTLWTSTADPSLTLNTVNFGFLKQHDQTLQQLAVLAERYLFTDPNTALIKIRQLAESLAKSVALLMKLPAERFNSRVVQNPTLNCDFKIDSLAEGDYKSPVGKWLGVFAFSNLAFFAPRNSLDYPDGQNAFFVKAKCAINLRITFSNARKNDVSKFAKP